jgi:hypothetical protein
MTTRKGATTTRWARPYGQPYSPHKGLYAKPDAAERRRRHARRPPTHCTLCMLGAHSH